MSGGGIDSHHGGICDLGFGRAPYAKHLYLCEPGFDLCCSGLPFISGFVLFQRYREGDFAYFPFLKKRLRQIVLPYFLWTLFYYGLFVVRNIYPLSFRFFLQKLLLGDLVYHLYFVVLIVQFYLLFGIFRWLFQKYSSHFLLLGFFLINVLFMKYVYFSYADRFFIQYSTFFALGLYFAVNYQNIKEVLGRFQAVLLLAVAYLAVSVLLAQQYEKMYVLQQGVNSFLYNLLWLFFSVLAIVFYYSIALLLQNSPWTALKSFLARLSDGSYLIYLSHPLVLMLAPRVIKAEHIPSTALHFLCTLVLVLGTVLCVLFYRSLKSKLLSKA